MGWGGRREHNAAGRDWSWSQLVALHGEENALIMLENMPGLGQFAPDWGTGAALDSADLHDEAPRLAGLGPCDLDIRTLGISRRERELMGAESPFTGELGGQIERK